MSSWMMVMQVSIGLREHSIVLILGLPQASTMVCHHFSEYQTAGCGTSGAASVDCGWKWKSEIGFACGSIFRYTSISLHFHFSDDNDPRATARMLLHRSPLAHACQRALSSHRRIALPRRRHGSTVGTTPPASHHRIRTALVVIGAGTVITAAGLLLFTDRGQMVTRPATFWRGMVPIYLQYRWVQWRSGGGALTEHELEAIYEELHRKHAPTVLELILSLRGYTC